MHRVGGNEFFVDAPVAVMPASWQDTGSGVFAVAVATLVLGFGPLRDEPSRRLAFSRCSAVSAPSWSTSTCTDAAFTRFAND